MNCKPGDLAIIVSSDYEPDPDIGRIVRVVGDAGYDYGDGLQYWTCVAEGGSPLRFEYGYTGAIGYSLEVDISDKDLRPIRPDGITDKEVADLYAPGPRVKETA